MMQTVSRWWGVVPRIVAAAALTASTLVQVVVARPAFAAETFDVQVGLGDPTMMSEINRFGPAAVTVRAGDTVKWTFAGFHSVSLGPPLPPPAARANGDIVALSPDFLPAGGDSYDGTGRAASGVAFTGPAEPYMLRFTKPGVYSYVCDLHPGMEGSVTVLAAEAALPESAAQARARGQMELHIAAGRRMAISARVATERVMNVHSVLAGFNDGFGGTAFQYLPGEIEVKRGDTVVWTLGDPQEIHTITFLSGQKPPEAVEVRPAAAGPPDVVFPAKVAQPQGGSMYTGQGYVNSGLLGIVRGDYAWGARIDAPAGRYQYLCLVHPWMTGALVVSE